VSADCERCLPVPGTADRQSVDTVFFVGVCLAEAFESTLKRNATKNSIFFWLTDFKLTDSFFIR
jgi:hypothetical protein